MLPRRWHALLPVMLPILVIACDRGASDRTADLAALDNQLVGNAAATDDVALTSALGDQIMVDPALAQQANADALQPPPQPVSGAVPPDKATPPAKADTAPLRSAPAAKGACPECGTRAKAQTLGAIAAGRKETAACAADVGYSARWADRLPGELPLYPDAKVREAAGNQTNGCALRIVSFGSDAPLARVIDFYYTRAIAAGYTAEHRSDGSEHVLGGTRGRDRASYMVFARARADGGTDVDLVVNRGG